MKTQLDWLAKGVFLAALSIALTGCPPKQKPIPVEEVAAEETPETPTVDESAQALEIGTDWATVPGLSPVYFDTGKAELSQDSRNTLKNNANTLKAILKSNAGVQIRLEGHCDERGTTEYNLALGQRRANSVREYYASLGLKKSSLKTVSFGEEKLLCFEKDESCWARCRRSETTLKSSTPLRIPLDQLSTGQ